MPNLLFVVKPIDLPQVVHSTFKLSMIRKRLCLKLKDMVPHKTIHKGYDEVTTYILTNYFVCITSPVSTLTDSPFIVWYRILFRIHVRAFVSNFLATAIIARLLPIRIESFSWYSANCLSYLMAVQAACTK